MTYVIQKGLTIIRTTPPKGDAYEGEDQNSKYKEKTNIFLKVLTNTH